MIRSGKREKANGKKKDRWGGLNKKLSLHYCSSQMEEHASSKSLQRKVRENRRSQIIEE